MDEYGWGSDDEIPVAELSDEERRTRRARAPRSRRWAALALVAALAGAGVTVVARVARDANGARRRVSTSDRRPATIIDNRQARVDVLAALHATTAAGSYAISSRLSETAANGTTRAPIVAHGTVNVDPTVMVATSNVSGAGDITARVNGTDVWEAGGGNFGMSADATAGPGAPLSQFAGLVTGSLGPRAGAVAMESMASPTGYLDLAEQSVTTASWIGDADFDGMRVHEYRVDVDAAQVLDRPGLTAEESKAATAAMAALREEGYLTTTVRLSIDGRGFVRRTQTSVRFADGGTVDSDVTFSNFGCSTVVMLPNGPSIVPDPAGCRPTTSPAATAFPPDPPVAPGTG